jgi:predicted permease
MDDVRFAVRSLRRRRTFAIVALTTIALSIGAATSIFSVVDAVLFRSLPYRDPGKLVAIWQTFPKWKKEPILAAMAERIPLDYADFLTWRRQQTSFTQIGVWTSRSILLSSNGAPEQLQGARISPSLFEVLGVKPQVGRGLLPGEDVIGGPRVTVMSYEIWQTRFGARRDILGRTILFDTVPWTVVGVMPKGFTLERGKPGAAFWVPAGQDKDDIEGGNHNFRAVGRLKPRVTMEQAFVETTRLLQGNTTPENRGVRLAEYHREETSEVRRPLLLLLGAVGVLLLVACVNIATLLLGEGAARQQEIAARMALGASRGRLIRQLLTESVVLSIAGALAGALVAWWATKVLVAIAPDRVPGIQTVHLDLRVLAVTAVSAIATGIAFGLVPALATSAAGPASLLRAGGQSAAGRGLLQRLLIATELGLSVVLLVGAALLSRSLAKLTSVDPGFRTENLLVVRLSLPASTFDSASRVGFYDEAQRRLAGLAGVAGVTAAGDGVPFTGNHSSSWFLKEGEEREQDRRTATQRRVVPSYFALLGIPVLSGRAFTAEDRVGAPLVAIVTEAAARRDWPNESPVSKRVKYQGEWRTIVGVVGDSKTNKLSADVEATIYTPVAQRGGGLSFMVRTRNAPQSSVAGVRRTLRELAPGVAITSIDVMDDLVRRSFAEERFRTVLISLFGIMAGVLAAVGLFGVTARTVSGRTREVGIRVALGATTASVVRMIVAHTLAGVTIGVVAGVLGAVAASRLLSPYLFGVTAYDPVAYGGIVGLLAAVSLVATWLPARRAGRVQPAMVLRGE